jgi:GT2 family glycosyltransferase
MPEKLISFVIPHLGRDPLLVETLESIASQDFDLSKIEVTVVTQNESLSKSVDELKTKLDLSIVFTPGYGNISELRNHGAALSSGCYLAFLDADVRLSANWIKSMMRELQAPVNTGGISGSRLLVAAIQIAPEQPTQVERIRSLLSNIRRDSYVDSLPGSNLFMSADTFARVGGFPADLQTCEDVYFTSEIARLGAVFYTSAASHVHLGEDKNFRQMFRKEIWRGQSNLLSIKGRRISLRELPSLIIPVGLSILLVAIPAFALLGYPALTVAAALMLLLPIVVYTYRLWRHDKDRTVGLQTLFRYYLVYFCARSIGTCLGLFKIQASA